MSIDVYLTCPIIKRFSEDLKLSGKSPRTLQSYCRALLKFMEDLDHDPDQATEGQLPARLAGAQAGSRSGRAESTGR